MNLETTYLGLKLAHPFVVGASPLCASLDGVRRAEDAGAAAIVFHSLFEEQLQYQEEGLEEHVLSYAGSSPEAESYFPQPVVEYNYGPGRYLEHLCQARTAVDIPLIASLNGTTLTGWTDFAKRFEGTHVDAIELNLYYQPRHEQETAAQVEERLLEIVRSVRAAVKLPIAVKLSPFFTSLPHFVTELHKAGADGVVLFNRFYQPDIDIDALEINPFLELSTSAELPLRLRWLAMLHGRHKGLSLASSGGVQCGRDAIKAVMSGADSVQCVSTLLRHGVGHIEIMRRQMAEWMEQKEYNSLKEMKGSMSYSRTPNPGMIERANYLQILQSWGKNEPVS